MGKSFIEFEKLLTKMKEQIEANISRLEAEMERLGSEDEIEDREDMASIVSDSLDHKSLMVQQRHELDEVNHALSKIAKGTYGICEKSGKQIPKERLRVEPHARCTIEEAE